MALILLSQHVKVGFVAVALFSCCAENSEKCQTINHSRQIEARTVAKRSRGSDLDRRQESAECHKSAGGRYLENVADSVPLPWCLSHPLRPKFMRTFLAAKTKHQFTGASQVQIIIRMIFLGLYGFGRAKNKPDRNLLIF